MDHIALTISQMSTASGLTTCRKDRHKVEGNGEPTAGEEVFGENTES